MAAVSSCGGHVKKQPEHVDSPFRDKETVGRGEREGRGGSGHHKDTIVAAVSKGDLSKGLWCAAISPTSVSQDCDWPGGASQG